MRAVRIARSVGRPSRLKKPPGIFPAAYIRSSTSTVSGKKSAPSRASVRPCAVPRTTVSPLRTITAPSACLASFPVSNWICLPPMSTDTETGTPAGCSASTMLISLLFLHCACVKGGSLGQRRLCCSSAWRSPKLHPPWISFPDRRLAAQAELLDEGAVALEIFALQVVQEPAAPADELQQPAARVVIVLVRAKVVRELVDALREHRDLHLRRARVGLVLAELLNVLQLLFLGEGHPSPLVDVSPRSWNAAKEDARDRDRVAQ